MDLWENRDTKLKLQVQNVHTDKERTRGEEMEMERERREGGGEDRAPHWHGQKLFASPLTHTPVGNHICLTCIFNNHNTKPSGYTWKLHIFWYNFWQNLYRLSLSLVPLLLLFICRGLFILFKFVTYVTSNNWQLWTWWGCWFYVVRSFILSGCILPALTTFVYNIYRLLMIQPSMWKKSWEQRWWLCTLCKWKWTNQGRRDHYWGFHRIESPWGCQQSLLLLAWADLCAGS